MANELSEFAGRPSPVGRCIRTKNAGFETRGNWEVDATKEKGFVHSTDVSDAVPNDLTASGSRPLVSRARRLSGWANDRLEADLIMKYWCNSTSTSRLLPARTTQLCF